MSHPKLSVWISSRNAKPFIAKCLGSLLSQSFTDWEAIVMDDASNDGMAEAAEAVLAGDRRFTLIRNETRQRQVGCFLQAFPQMRGDIIVELDGDDWFCSNEALAEIVRCYDNPEVEATSGRNRSTSGFESGGWTGARHHRFQNLAEAMCAPRSWYRHLTLKALDEMASCFYGPGGKPWQYAGDLALFAPVLYYAGAIASTPYPVYEINMMNPESDWVLSHREQSDCAAKLVEQWRVLGLQIAAIEPPEVAK